VAADPRFRRRGHWGRRVVLYRLVNFSLIKLQTGTVSVSVFVNILPSCIYMVSLQLFIDIILLAALWPGTN